MRKFCKLTHIFPLVLIFTFSGCETTGGGYSGDDYGLLKSRGPQTKGTRVECLTVVDWCGFEEGGIPKQFVAKSIKLGPGPRSLKIAAMLVYPEMVGNDKTGGNGCVDFLVEVGETYELKGNLFDNESEVWVERLRDSKVVSNVAVVEMVWDPMIMFKIAH